MRCRACYRRGGDFPQERQDSCYIQLRSQDLGRRSWAWLSSPRLGIGAGQSISRRGRPITACVGGPSATLFQTPLRPKTEFAAATWPHVVGAPSSHLYHLRPLSWLAPTMLSNAEQTDRRTLVHLVVVCNALWEHAKPETSATMVCLGCSLDAWCCA